MKVTVEHKGAPGDQAGVAEDGSLCVTDRRGRKIVVQRLTPVERLRCKRIIGGVNDDYYWEALPAFMVKAIDGEAIIKPTTILALEGLMTRLDNDGMAAIVPACAQLLVPPGPDVLDQAKN